jgi:hypothetical protein
MKERLEILIDGQHYVYDRSLINAFARHVRLLRALAESCSSSTRARSVMSGFQAPDAGDYAHNEEAAVTQAQA